MAWRAWRSERRAPQSCHGDDHHRPARSRAPEERPLLIGEVSDASLGFARITKARLYARQGITEYWIVNVGEQVIEVHREPSDGAWGSRTVHGAGETLRPVALPDVAVELGPLFAFTAAAG